MEMVTPIPSAPTPEWYNAFIAALSEAFPPLQIYPIWHAVDVGSLPTDQAEHVIAVFSAFGLPSSTFHGPGSCSVFEIGASGARMAFTVDSSRRLCFFQWIDGSWQNRSGALYQTEGIRITFDPATGAWEWKVTAGEVGKRNTYVIASRKSCAVRVYPINVERVVSGYGADSTIPRGETFTLLVGGTGAVDLTISASGYYDQMVTQDLTEASLDVLLSPIDGDAFVAKYSASLPGTSIRLGEDVYTAPAYLAVRPGDVLTASGNGMDIEHTVVAGETGFFFEFPQGSGGVAIPGPTTPGNMVLRVQTHVAGVLTYDNDGFFNDPPAMATQGSVDYEIPPPAIGTTGGVLKFSAGGTEHSRRIIFQADGTSLVHIGPMRITVTANGPYAVFFDEYGPLTVLPGDGNPQGVGDAGRPVTFLASSGGWVNIKPQGTDRVIRLPVEMAEGRTVELDVDLALAPYTKPGAQDPLSAGGLSSLSLAALAGALAGGAAGLLTK